MKDYKKQQLKNKLTSFPKPVLVKQDISEDQKNHFKKGIKITLNRADRRALKYPRNMNKQARSIIRFNKQWWLRYA